MKKFTIAAAIVFAAASTTLQAQVTQSFGAGSAVTTVNASASFESLSALFDNPYLEGGMTFSRTNLSFDNNGCGFAGCLGQSAIPSSSGNYMYGNGSGGYFTMKAASGQQFSGLEFLYGNGYGSTSMHSLSWSAYLGGSLISSGSSVGPIAASTVLGFSGAFDELRYSDLNGSNAPAFDEVRAQYGAVVPEPSTWTLMATGLLFVGNLARRKRNVI